MIPMNGVSFQTYSMMMPQPKPSPVNSGNAAGVPVSPAAWVTLDSTPA